MSFGEFVVVYFMGFIGALSYVALEKLTRYIKYRKFLKLGNVKAFKVGRYGKTELLLVDENGKECK